MEKTPDLEKILSRLKRVEGQVRGLQKLITGGEAAEKVLPQISAVRSALHRIGVLYLMESVYQNLQKDDLPNEVLQDLKDKMNDFSQLL